jgi:hypothetical protein
MLLIFSRQEESVIKMQEFLAIIGTDFVELPTETPIEQRSQILWNGTRAQNCPLRFRCHFAAVLTAALIVTLF